MKKWQKITVLVLTFVMGAWGGEIVTKRIIQDERQVITEIVRQSSDLTEWELLEMAFVKTESNFDPYARSNKDALGIFQETEIFVKECNNILGEEKYVHSEAYNPKKAIEMFNIYQNDKNPKHDQDKAIYLHNPGGKSIGYAGMVYKSLAEIKKYEEIRKMILEYSEEHPTHHHRHRDIDSTDIEILNQTDTE